MEHHPRHIIHNFIPLQICKELEFIHKSNCTVGYRPNVFSTTLSHLIATNCSHLIMPFIPIRGYSLAEVYCKTDTFDIVGVKKPSQPKAQADEMVKEKVEELFGCEFELFVEFTGLISWTKGASIGWHSDDNRSYLKQRDFTEDDMSAAHSLFNKVKRTFTMGRVSMGAYFTFRMENQQITYLWLGIWSCTQLTIGTYIVSMSRNSSYDEDEKLISRVAQTISNNEPTSCIPLPGSSNMYWFSSDQGSDQLQGFDIRYARLLSLGYDISTTQGKTSDEMNSTIDVSDVFTEPLRLARGDTLFNKKFANLLHALQAVQFYYWSRSNLPQTEGVRNPGDIILLSEAQKQDVSYLRCLLSSTMKLDASIFCHPSSNTIRDSHFDPESFSEALTSWEEYAFKLHEQLTVHLPFWKEYRSLFSVSLQVVKN